MRTLRTPLLSTSLTAVPMTFMPSSPEHPDVLGASSRALPPTARTPVDAGSRSGAGSGDVAPTTVRGAVRGLHREHARRAWATRSPGVPDDGADLGGGPSDASDPLVELLATLRDMTTCYVYRLRADGMRPEQMLVRVKAFVREAMAAEGWQDPEAVEALTSAVVRWSIAAYYDR